MDAIGKVIPALPPVPAFNDVACVWIDGGHGLGAVMGDPEDGYAVFRPSLQPFDKGAAGPACQRSLRLVGYAQRNGVLGNLNGDLLTVAAVKEADIHHHHAGHGQNGQKGNDEKAGVEVPAPCGEIESVEFGRACAVLEIGAHGCSNASMQRASWSG